MIRDRAARDAAALRAVEVEREELVVVEDPDDRRVRPGRGLQAARDQREVARDLGAAAPDAVRVDRGRVDVEAALDVVVADVDGDERHGLAGQDPLRLDELAGLVARWQLAPPVIRLPVRAPPQLRRRVRRPG